MAKKRKPKPWFTPWVKRKVKSKSKKVWANHKKNKVVRRKNRQTVRKTARATRRTVATTKTSGPAAAGVAAKTPPSPIEFSHTRKRKNSGKFLGKHHRIAGGKDRVARVAHSFLDNRELRTGIITSSELDQLGKYDSQEEWRMNMLAKRKENYRTQQARNRDTKYGPLTMVYSVGGGAGVGKVQHVGFRPPTARQTDKKTNAPTWQPQPRSQPIVRKRKNHVSKLVTAWGPQMQQNASKAMAADGNLSGAVSSLNSFAETFPETRTQVHDYLGKLAAFGEAYSAAMESMISTLSQGKSEANPGLPPEVVSHLQPLTEVGSQIRQAGQETLAAWEDYFAEAIKVAQDEHVPSKQALMS
jgi:hypothetical protein